jgi:hypothetical protein
MTDEREWFEQLFDLQLEQNASALDKLHEEGLAEDAPVRLEFFYAAPGEPEARNLVAFLRTETDYTVEAFERRDGMDANTPWLVVGMTQPTPVSLELLNEWTEWMIAAGAEKGPCAFDGWDAEV